MAIKITSDSTCDLTKELLEKHDIELFPLYITLGGKTLRDGVEITPDDIFCPRCRGRGACVHRRRNAERLRNALCSA